MKAGILTELSHHGEVSALYLTLRNTMLVNAVMLRHSGI